MNRYQRDDSIAQYTYIPLPMVNDGPTRKQEDTYARSQPSWRRHYEASTNGISTTNTSSRFLPQLSYGKLTSYDRSQPAQLSYYHYTQQDEDRRWQDADSSRGVQPTAIHGTARQVIRKDSWLSEGSQSSKRQMDQHLFNYSSGYNSYVQQPSSLEYLPSVQPHGRNSSDEEMCDTFVRGDGCTGLHNLGNTCFMNSIIQCLSNTRPLLEFCLDAHQYKLEITQFGVSSDGRLISSYTQLMHSLWCNKQSISPTDFYLVMSQYASRFADKRQHDAQEFLVTLLECLQKDLARGPTTRSVLRHDSNANTDCRERITSAQQARESWKQYLKCDNSKIVDIFVGQMKSTLVCSSCRYSSNTFDPFVDISLPVRKRHLFSSETSLTDCFNLFMQQESLTGDDRPMCDRCRQRQKSVKHMSIQKFPEILVIHLKRFSYDSLQAKVSVPVKCPHIIDLEQYAAEKSATGKTMYKLFAVINHSGTPFGGHYTAYAKNPYSQEWHLFNDNLVHYVSASQVITPEAYILFYEFMTGLH